jgi:sec-independent protein translocase protein TatC
MAPSRHDDDLFKDSTMTFGEHLEELRVCLLRAVIGLAVGLVVGMGTAHIVVRWISVPMRTALATYYREKGITRLEELRGIYRDLSLGADVVPPYATEYVDSGGKIYDVYQVDVGLLWELLSRKYPDQLAQRKLTRYRISAADVRDPRRLCESLVDATRVPWAEHMWLLLDETARADLSRMAKAGQFSEKDRERIADVLNGLVAKKDLFDTKALSNFGLDDYSRELATRTSELAEDDQTWLNRKVLATVTNRALAAPDAEFVPLFFWRDAKDDPRTQLSTLSQTEPFMVYMKAAFVVAFIVAGPWVFYQLWVFVAAGLYPHEKHYVYVFGPMSLGLFVLGVATAFLLVFQPVLYFLLKFNDMLGLYPEPRMNEFLGFVLILPLGFGVSFQLPLVMLFLERIGIFTVQTYLEKWRIAVLAICIISAFLTPADPWSMIFMSVPLCALYGVGIGLCKYLPRKVNQYEEEEKPGGRGLVGAT